MSIARVRSLPRVQAKGAKKKRTTLIESPWHFRDRGGQNKIGMDAETK
jgi:hypothetical protein